MRHLPMNSSTVVAPPGIPRPQRKNRRARRLLAIPLGVLLAGAVIAVNIPTVGTALADRYHQYQITRPAYEAKYGLWVKLDIPAKFRVNGIHSTLLHNGDVLIMAGSGNNQAFFDAGTFKTLLLDPVTMKERLIHTPWDLFCAGHIELPDGNILVAGGTARYENLKPTHAGGSMTVVNDDPTQPWHLPKGTIFAGPGGVRFASAFALTILAAKRHVGPTGTARVVATKQNVWVDAVEKGKGSLMPAADRYVLRDLLGPANGKLYGVGTAMTLQKQDFQGTNDAYIFNVKTSSFQDVSSMHYARWYPTLAEMGNGMVMTMSGLDGQGQVTVNSEMFNPATRTWAQGPVHGFPTYPATFLTEDGRLFFTGSIAGYYPPYMFQGTRPRIEEAPTVMEPGHRYIISVSEPSKIRYLRLMRPDNPTHVTDVNARSIAVPFRPVGGNDLDVTIPSNTNLIPPGYYMMFAVNRSGIPSTAAWVRVP